MPWEFHGEATTHCATTTLLADYSRGIRGISSTETRVIETKRRRPHLIEEETLMYIKLTSISKIGTFPPFVVLFLATDVSEYTYAKVNKPADTSARSNTTQTQIRRAHISSIITQRLRGYRKKGASLHCGHLPAPQFHWLTSLSLRYERSLYKFIHSCLCISSKREICCNNATLL